MYAIDKEVKEHQPQERSLGVTTHHHPPRGHRATDYNTLAVTFQRILYPSNSPLFGFTLLHFRDKDVAWDYIEGHAHIQHTAMMQTQDGFRLPLTKLLVPRWPREPSESAGGFRFFDDRASDRISST